MIMGNEVPVVFVLPGERVTVTLFCAKWGKHLELPINLIMWYIIGTH